MRDPFLLRSFRVLSLISALLVTATPARAGLSAQYDLGRGWATFGIAPPQGAVPDGIRVGSLPTQTDVKTTWPDGSTRFAIVTAEVDVAGRYPLTAAPRESGTFAPTWPTASVELTIAGQRWVAALPPSGGTDRWLSGPYVVEARARVAPVFAGQAHKFLRVLYDVRSYRSGGHRVDVAVENVLNVPETDAVTYNVNMIVNGQSVFSKLNVLHASFARWRKIFATGGLQEASVAPDFTPFYDARAIPSFLPSVISPVRATDSPEFEILETGSLAYPMDMVGGRDEIGPYPAWTAQYLVHKTPSQREYMLRHGDNASGAWSIHITESDGSLINLDLKPMFWLGRHTPSPNTDGNDGPANGHKGIRYQGEIGSAHVPSLGYVPYLVTGDRFFLDEMKFWANHALISWNGAPGGNGGVITGQNQERGIAWGMRNFVDAAAYSPDNDPERAYFIRQVGKNLASLDVIANSPEQNVDPFGAMFISRGKLDLGVISPNPQIYLAWSILHAHHQGFTNAGLFCMNRLIRYVVNLYNSHPAFDRDYIPDFRRWALKDDGTPFSNYQEMFNYTYGGPTPRRPKPGVIGLHGTEHRIALVIATAMGLQGASQALDALMAYASPTNPARNMVWDTNRRSQWAITLESAMLPGGPIIIPQPPTNLRIVGTGN